MNAYFQRDRADRIRALRDEAERRPEGLGRHLLAVAFWEEGNLDEAFRLAEPLLQETPQNFDLLLICLTFHLKYDNEQQIDAYARRLAVARSPGKLLRTGTVVLNIILFPFRLLGLRPRSHDYADVLDSWSQWAREYVKENSSVQNGA